MLFLSYLTYPKSTPLHMASQNGNLEMLDFLLQKGANLLDTDAEGDTAEKVAANQEISDFLAGMLFADHYHCNINIVFAGHIQVCFLQEKILALPFLDGVSQRIESTAKQLYGPNVTVKFDPDEVHPNKEILVHVSLPESSMTMISNFSSSHY